MSSRLISTKTCPPENYHDTGTSPLFNMGVSYEIMASILIRFSIISPSILGFSQHFRKPPYIFQWLRNPIVVMSFQKGPVSSNSTGRCASTVGPGSLNWQENWDIAGQNTHIATSHLHPHFPQYIMYKIV